MIEEEGIILPYLTSAILPLDLRASDGPLGSINPSPTQVIPLNPLAFNFSSHVLTSVTGVGGGGIAWIKVEWEVEVSSVKTFVIDANFQICHDCICPVFFCINSDHDNECIREVFIIGWADRNGRHLKIIRYLKKPIHLIILTFTIDPRIECT